MTTRHELDRSISAWLEAEAPDRAPDDVLEASRERLRTIRQRRAWLPARRYSPMNMYTKLAAAAAVVLVVGFAGYQLLPRDGGPGGPGGPSIAPSPTPSIAPSPTPAFLARGTFKAKGADVVLDARGRGSDVTGTMSVSYGGGDFTVDLECSRTTASGLLWIGGDVTESTDTELGIKGTRTAIVFKPGSPVRAVFIFQLDDPDSASCQAFFDDMIAIGGEPRPGPDGLEPIEGTVELAP